MKKILTSAAILLSASGIAMADTPPEFPGGTEAMLQFVASNVQYPQTAIDNMIEGTVTVEFTVNADGSISNARVTHPLDPDLETEALRIVTSFPTWEPARDDTGNPKAEQVDIPIKFRLP